jgi:hypothetical protein
MVVDLVLSAMRRVSLEDFLALGFIEVAAEQLLELNSRFFIIEPLHRLIRA